MNTMRELKEELKMTSSGRKFLKETEPCEDAVSREDVIKAVDRHTFDTDDGLCLDEDISIILEELPPVKPVTCIAKVNFNKEDMQEIVNKKVEDMVVRKKGHWIMTNDYFTGAYGNIDYVKCSCCGEDSLEEGDYCPNCGSLMSEEV